jgi:hypothetical protein
MAAERGARQTEQDHELLRVLRRHPIRSRKVRQYRMSELSPKITSGAGSGEDVLVQARQLGQYPVINPGDPLSDRSRTYRHRIGSSPRSPANPSVR